MSKADEPRPDDLEPLVLDMLEWVARAPRTYREVMDAWRTSCPRLTVWENAVDRGLLTRKSVRDTDGTRHDMVELTAAGCARLAARNHQPLPLAAE